MNTATVSKTPGTLYHHTRLDYTPEALATLIKLYQDAIPTQSDKEIVEAKVTHIDNKEVIVDLQAKSDGIIPITEFKDLPNLKVGDIVKVYVQEQENSKGELVISRKNAKLIQTWKMIKEAFQTGTVLQGVVKRKIKGGLVLDIFDIEVFLPGSQINTSQTTDFDQLIGQTLDVCVIKINHAKDNAVVSRKAVIEKEEAKQREVIIRGLEKGQILSGKVKNITSFGVFINLGGIAGLLHKRDMAWNFKFEDPAQARDSQGNLVFTLEKSIKVMIKDFDLEKNYISLSTKLLAWGKIPKDVEPGSRVKGIVREIADNYALIELAQAKGVIGLLHISEMSYSKRIKHPKECITLNEERDVEILTIDRETQELRVGIRQFLPDPWQSDTIAKYQPNTRHKGIVCNITKNGAYIELEPGIEGFLHQRRISWTQKDYPVDTLLSPEKEIEVMVLEVDQEKRLFQLGLRELEKNPWSTFKKIFSLGSKHKGTIVNVVQGGVIVELSHGIQNFVPNKDLPKEIREKPMTDVIIDFHVIDFLEEEQKIMLSTNEPEGMLYREDESSSDSTGNPTLGEFAVLQQLKHALDEKERENKVRKPTS